MKKNWAVFKITLQEYLVYRLNFFLWRFRSFIFFLTLVYFWKALFLNRQTLFAYSQSQILIYVIGTVFMRGLILGSKSAGELPYLIKGGDLISWLTRPVSLFHLYFTRDLVAKILDTFFAVIEISLVVKIFNLTFFLPSSEAIFFFVLTLVFSIVLNFLVAIFIASLSFWFEEAWATRWLFGVVLLEFMAGVYFPLDVLPPKLIRLINLTPFPYLIFYPLKILTETFSISQMTKSLVILFVWTVLFYFLAKKVWRKGLAGYAAYGG